MAETKKNYAQLREFAKDSRAGFFRPIGTKSAVETPDEERNTILEAEWNNGGLPFQFAFTDTGLVEKANDYAAGNSTRFAFN